MCSEFSATVGDLVLYWRPELPNMTGDAEIVSLVRAEIDCTFKMPLAVCGPYMISIEAYAPVVFTAINKVYGFENVTFVNPPDLSSLINPIKDDLREIEY